MSPCSPKHAKHCNPHHALIVTEYRAARMADEIAYDIEYGGTTTEARENRHRLITFRDWLIGMRRQ